MLFTTLSCSFLLFFLENCCVRTATELPNFEFGTRMRKKDTLLGWKESDTFTFLLLNYMWLIVELER